MKTAYHSDIGRRRASNQDRCCVLKNNADEVLGIVCDGMGGHLAGEHAADIAMDIVCQSFLEISPLCTEKKALQWLNEAIEKANATIYADATSNKEHQGMGTTLVLALYLKDVILIGHVGDSRAYVLEGDTLKQLTQDHTYVNLLIESGSINKEQAKVHPQRNILMKAVGVFENVVISHQILPMTSNILCLCSDGLYNCVEEAEMTSILQAQMSLEEKVMTLVTKANLNGGYDNISVVLMEKGGTSHE